MTTAECVSGVCVALLLGVVLVVSLDRNRLRRRLGNAEGRVTALSLDLQALQERVGELTSYLNRADSWQVDAQPPSRLTSGAPVDRWSRTAPSTPPAVLDAGEASAADPDDETTDATAEPRRRASATDTVNDPRGS